MKKLVTIALLGLLAASLAGNGVLASSLSLDTLILKYFVFQDKATGRYYVKPVKGSTTVDTSTPVNPPPVADAGENKTLAQGQAEDTLDGSGSHSSASTIVSYHWEQIAGTASAIITPDSVATIVNNFSGAGDYTYQLTVKDADSLTGTASVVITVPPLLPDEYWVLKHHTFNFTPVAQNIADSITDVVGDPSVSVVTATDTSTGWSVGTIGTDTTLWNPNPTYGDKSSGDFGMKWTTPSDPYDYTNFDSAILTTGFINYNSERVPGTYNLKISGLDPNHLYQLHIIGSITQTDSTSIDQGSTRTLYYASDGQGGSLNTQWRTSKSVVLDTITPSIDSTILLSVTGQDTGYANGAMGVISGLTIYEISKDSSAGAKKTQLYRNYYDTAIYINDGGINRLCIVYKPYNYDPSKSYPIFLYMDGQEDAVFNYAWDPQILTGDGMGLIGEGEKGKLYGINAKGDTCGFVLIIPQNSANEFSLTTDQMHTLLTNFRAKDLYNTNDSLFLAGFSSGGASAVKYLYTYPSEVTAAFIQSPASPPPSSSVLRDSSAKFTQYGTHVWLVERGDAFSNYVDSIAKYIRLGSPNNLYERYVLGKNHNGFAYEYLPTTKDQIYPQNIYSFFFNPTENRRKFALFTIWTPSSNILFWNPVYNGSSINAHSAVLTGTDSNTGWSINTVSTSKWDGNGTAVTNFDQVRSYNFWTNYYVQAARTIYSSGSYASDGNNLQITGLTPGKSYTVYMGGYSHYGNVHSGYKPVWDQWNIIHNIL